jgi:hypothetical protein
MPTINDLRQQAATIKNATQVGENTATRVGTTFETIADLLESMGGVTNLSTIDIGSIDALNTTGDMLVGTPNIYTLTKTIGANTFKVGTLFQFANNGRYDVAQVIVSQFIVDADGRIDTTSADQEVHIFYRLCKTMNGGSLPTPIGTWTTWTELGGSGGSGVTIDPYPTQNSGNAVSSGGVFERLQDIAPKVDISAIDDIDEYSDMLATKSPFYVVTKTLSGNVFRIGTLMEFSNQGRYILYQILATDYVLNDDGTLDTTLSENGGLKLIWRMKQFSGNPPVGVTIGVWSSWSYLSGGGGGEIDAYTKSETNALLAQKQDNLTFDNSPTPNSNNPVKSNGIYAALDGKFEKAGGTITGNVTFNGSIILHDLAQIQEGNVEMTDVLDERYELKLTWDNTPTASSNNPVKSGGVYDYVINSLSGYTPTANFATINGSVITQGGNIQVLVPQGAITIDAAPSPNSQNAVSSGGVYDAIEGGFYY